MKKIKMNLQLENISLFFVLALCWSQVALADERGGVKTVAASTSASQVISIEIEGVVMAFDETSVVELPNHNRISVPRD